MKNSRDSIDLEYDIPGWNAELGWYQDRISELHERLHAKELSMSGWIDWPGKMTEDEIRSIEETAGRIREKCTAVVVIGVGGSYLGAKACIELLKSPFYNEHAGCGMAEPKVYFAGHHVSSIYYTELLKQLDREEVCLCAVSKSGTTLEPSIVFTILQRYMEERYGEAEAAKRIWVVTDSERGEWRRMVREKGYGSFVIPENVGGRYSVLTPVGLLPAAVCGIDIRKMLWGARKSMQEYSDPSLEANACYRYALLRYMLQLQGKLIEVYEVYEGKFRYFTEWLKQLFAESECKDGKGILPVSLQMSTDLHSMGQYLQEGRQTFFETVITADFLENDISLEGIPAAGAARSMHELNRIISRSVMDAHAANATPQISITIPEVSAYSFGRMVYFFEKACAMSCLLTGVNPFDQPGVEAYKRNIKKRLNLL